MAKTGLKFLCLVLVIILNNPPAHAFLGDLTGVGVRASALGEAFVAIADDYSATYYNPAGLGQLKDELKMTVDWIFQFPKFDVTSLETGEDLVAYRFNGREHWNPVKTGGGDHLDDIDHGRPIIGLNTNLTQICSALNIPFNLNFGLVMMIPNSFHQILTLHDFIPDVPKFTRFGDPDEQLFISLGLGGEVVKDLLYLGLSFQMGIYADGVLYNGGAGIMIQGPEADASVDEGDLVFQVQINWRVFANLEPIAGILFTPFDKRLKLGVTYRDETTYALGPFNVLMNYRSAIADQGSAIPWNGMMELFLGFAPESWAVGLAYDFDGITLSAAAEIQKWSKFPLIGLYDDPYFNTEWEIVGYMPADPEFNDIVNISLGMEFRLTKNLTILTGYRHLPTPVPDQSGRVTNYLDMDKDAFSFGCTFLFFKNRIRIGGMFEYMICQDYKVYKDGVQGFTWLQQESFEVKGDVYTMGLSAEINF